MFGLTAKRTCFIVIVLFSVFMDRCRGEFRFFALCWCSLSLENEYSLLDVTRWLRLITVSSFPSPFISLPKTELSIESSLDRSWNMRNGASTDFLRSFVSFDTQQTLKWFEGNGLWFYLQFSLLLTRVCLMDQCLRLPVYAVLFPAVSWPACISFLLHWMLLQVFLVPVLRRKLFQILQLIRTSVSRHCPRSLNAKLDGC